MLMMMDYGSQYAPSVMSSETLSNSCGSSGSTSRTNRIRTIRLVRPSGGNGILSPPTLTCRHGPNLGFSLRGGREHGTGFFVSYVEPASEAHRQGLRVGDQIIRINGFTVDDAVHKEVLQLISNHTHLTLKVRSVGMIPVKDKKTDTLSWQIVTDNSSSLRSSPQFSEKIQDVRISITVPPRSKLGCGICKGPDWKPGIFIQFTKDNGIAREAGLRPGDQILYCNNVDFSDIPFNEAVNLMKTSRQLDLIVRKSAGSELFPSESSGYNSSASSVTGDQSPSWSDSKRLSIVKEESHDLEERLDKLRTMKWERNKGCSNIDDFDRKPIFKPTIINLSENGTTIKNNGSEEECYDDTINQQLPQQPQPPQQQQQQQQQFETKTVVVEVHRTTNQEIKNDLTKSSSTSSFGSLTSTTSSSLSSAICLEIQRRSEKKKNENNKPTIDEQLQMKRILKGVTSEKQHQHNKLMDEFKKAHQKMFKSLDGTGDPTQLQFTTDGNSDRIANRDLTQKLTERLANLTTENNETTASPPPPPPPPFPVNHHNPDNNNNNSFKINDNHNNIDGIDGQKNGTKTNKKPKAPPVPVKTSTLSAYQQSPPPCPTPDYDSLSITSASSLQRTINNNKNNSKASQDCVEMDSLESFKLNNSNICYKPIKPPDTYFNNHNNSKMPLSNQLSNGSTSSCSSNQSVKQSKQRPISVTIGEYPSGTVRRQPARFDFLQNNSIQNNGSVTREFASELAQTLNRSNLRKRTESLENLLNCQHIKAESNGSIRISLNSSLSKHLAKSIDDLSSYCSNTLTINIHNNNTNNNEKKNETAPNGILKSGNHKPLVQQKSITFGEMPTVINDHPLHVT